MCQFDEELTFCVLSVTRFENSLCFCNFLELFQEAKVFQCSSGLPSIGPLLCFMATGGVPLRPENDFLGSLFWFFWKCAKLMIKFLKFLKEFGTYKKIKPTKHHTKRSSQIFFRNLLTEIFELKCGIFKFWKDVPIEKGEVLFSKIIPTP